jgi:hypothetical protein
MKEHKHCPFCGKAEVDGCAHLALAVKQTEFISQCIARSQTEAFWRKLMNNRHHPVFTHTYGSDELTWNEMTFAMVFLRGLDWFGGQDYQWRDGTAERPGTQWVILWSKEPQRLWRQLRDEIARHAEDFERVVAGPEIYWQGGEPIVCPICGKDPQVEECEHLVFHGDDLGTKEILEDCGPQGGWNTLATIAPGFLPELASEFFDEFSRHFAALEAVQDSGWGGETPGLSGQYCFVWSRHPVKLCDEICRFLDSEIRKRKSKARRSKSKATTKPRRRSRKPA